MTARDWTTLLLAVAGAVVREVGLALVVIGDHLDPDANQWADEDEHEELYVPDCFLVDRR